MARKHNRTTMGGPFGKFQTTHWTELFDAKTLDETRRKEAVNELIELYWKPVYCYLRRKGYSNEPAKDLTQGFFYEVAMGRKLFQQADQSKGKFRTFLLTALDRYTIDMHNKETAKKRSPQSPIISLEADDLSNFLEMRSGPDQVFNYTWASEILNQVLEEAKETCIKRGKEVHWQVFFAKTVEPILNNSSPLALKDLGSKYKIDDTQTISNMISYVKDIFRSTMMRNLRQYVRSDDEVEEEFNDILKILSQNK